MVKINRWQQSLVVVVVLIVLGVGAWYLAKVKADNTVALESKSESQKLELCLKAAWTDFNVGYANECEYLGLDRNCRLSESAPALKDDLKNVSKEVSRLIDEFQKRQNQCVAIYPIAAKQKADTQLDSCLKTTENQAADMPEDNWKKSYLETMQAFCFKYYESYKRH